MEVQAPAQPSRRLKPLAAVLASFALLATVAGCGADKPADTDPALTPEAVKRAPERKSEKPAKRAGSQPRVVQLEGGGDVPVGDAKDDGPSPGAQSDAEVRAELREARRELRSFKGYLSTAYLATGARAKVLKDGTAQAPDDAPDAVKQVISAGNAIAKFPYKWGGGHGAWRDNGYDCSGSVSFALAAAGMLDRPMVSGGFMNWGEEGPGEWITTYANGGHMFMVVAGLRFDTSGQGRAGTRWQEAPRSTAGFAVRHPPGF